MKLGLFATLFVLIATAGSAFAQSAGQDGAPIYYSNGWSGSCYQVRFPKGSTSAKILITGVSSVCASGSCSNAGGDADLYVYATTAGNTTKPATKAGGYVCRPYVSGNEESCSFTIGTGADQYYWACVDGYSNYNTVQMRAEFNLGVNGSTTTATAGSTWYIDYWKNNLFLGIAYHRFGCFSNDMMIVDDKEYDGFTDTDYCRYGQNITDPSTRGGSTTYMISYMYAGYTWQTIKNWFESCGSKANTDYNTPNYQRRSNSCSYNVITNCNSDCWIRDFSTCEHGSSISIASPCW
ncbi:MAG TPA: hypothetical protein VL463_03475 [Kofleriaceae bacterium]|jgi:hypothetical protein|nr:hypothetical protein [Kofleriaceae bacterium]